MASSYPDEFAGLIEAATAAADAHQRDLGKRKRGEEDAYVPVSSDLSLAEPLPPKTPILSNSAAVLFREPSEKSKKYSRPPLGKVFTSLELAPEAFLRLQNAAKAYMLNDEHPERKDVVGHKKHNNNNDQAKLKLYQCVEDFLQQEDNGEKFFGHTANLNSPDAPSRTFFWPDDRGRIVKALMPLLRKMVTNERQRVYAAETRKSDTKKDGKKNQRDARSDEDSSHVIDENMVCDIDQAQTSPSMAFSHWQLTAKQNPQIDPSLQQDMRADQNGGMLSMAAQDAVPMQQDAGAVNLRVSIVTKDGDTRKRLMPDFSLASEDAGTIEQFIDGLKKNLDILSGGLEVKALLPSGGLTPMKNEEDWLMAQLAVSSEEWMNGQLQLLVEV